MPTPRKGEAEAGGYGIGLSAETGVGIATIDVDGLTASVDERRAAQRKGKPHNCTTLVTSETSADGRPQWGEWMS